MGKDALVLGLTNEFLEYIDKKNIVDTFEVSQLCRQVFDQISEALLERDSGITNQIRAENAVVEILDKDTGQIYRRYLEIEYDENHNGLRLSGETMNGEETQIAFLSDQAINKLAELRGEGPEEPLCHKNE